MPTKSSQSSDAKATDAIALLTADHKAVKALFDDFKQLAEDDEAVEEKTALVQTLCNELTVHAEIEEELFYPAARDALDDDPLLDEAEVEHATAKDLIEQLQTMIPGDNLFDAKVTVLSEYIDHHVKEEESELFPKLRATDLDTTALGRAMARRKVELKAELVMLGEEPPAMRPGRASNGSKRAAKSAR